MPTNSADSKYASSADSKYASSADSKAVPSSDSYEESSATNGELDATRSSDVMQSPNRGIAYVDGFNLYNGMHDAYGHKFLWLDLVALIQKLRPSSTIIKVKYFTATLLNDPDAQGRQTHYIEALKAMNPGKVEVFYGRYQQKPMQCKDCGAEWMSYEEKETDVNIAVEVLSDVVAGNSDDFYIVSADSDLAPAIRRSRSLNSNAFCVVFFPPKRRSEELAKLMPNSIVIGRQKLHDSQLPDTVKSRIGEFTRPAKWIKEFEELTIDLASRLVPVPKPGPHLSPERR